MLTKKRFAPLFATQFLGALNDNLFKNALLVIIVSQVVSLAGNSVNFITNLAVGLFILPYLLFSTTAGQLADRFDKAMLIRRIKLTEILIMLAGCYALYSLNLYLMLGILFLLGMQSTFFGPLKYAIIPQHLHSSELLAGNAQVGMGTFVSILLGTLVGSWMVTVPDGRYYLGAATVAAAVIGWLCSRAIPEAPATETAEMTWHPVRNTIDNFALTRQDPTVFYCVLGISWFWLFGGCILTQVPNFAVAILHGEPQLISVLLAAFIVGVAAGCLLCSKLSGNRVEPGIIPLGAMGLSAFSIDLYLAANNYQTTLALLTPVSAMQFIGLWAGLHILLDLVCIGLFGGFFIVPLYAMVQARTDSRQRARVIAANNIMNAVFMISGSLLGMACLTLLGLTIPEFFLFMGLLNAAVLTCIFYRAPEFIQRFIAWLTTNMTWLRKKRL